MNALLKISFLSILAIVVCQTANAGQLVARAHGVEVWKSGTPGDYTFEFLNRNAGTADVYFILDGKAQNISIEAQGSESVSSSEVHPVLRLVSVSLFGS